MNIQSTLRPLAVLLVLAAGGFALTFGHRDPSAAPVSVIQDHPERRGMEPRTIWALEDADDPLVQFVKHKPPPPPVCSDRGMVCGFEGDPPCCPGLECAFTGDRVECEPVF